MNEQASKGSAVRPPLKGIRVGVVTSAKAENTRRVEVTHRSRVPKYGKFVSQRSVFHVHDSENASKLGDTVEIAPCRPISKTKSWRLVRVVGSAAA